MRARVLAVLAMAVSAIAVVLLPDFASAVPSRLTAQGKLTNPGGLPQVGTFTFTFRIYDGPAGGTDVWTGGVGESQAVTTDANGLWTAQLGVTTALTDAVFNGTERWLEITVDNGVDPPETLTRVKLNTNPYSYRVSTIGLATGGNVTGNTEFRNPATPGDKLVMGVGDPNIALELRSGQTGGSPFIDFSNDAVTDADARLQLTEDGTLEFSAATSPTFRVVGRLLATERIGVGTQNPTDFLDVVGAMTVRRAEGVGDIFRVNAFDPNVAVELRSGTTNGTPFIDFSNDVVSDFDARIRLTADGVLAIEGPPNPPGGGPSVVFDLNASTAAGASVVVPDNAINNEEIFDEPGIAANNASEVTLVQDAVAMVDLVTVTLTIPRPGYIIVQGRTIFESLGTTGQNFAFVQVSEGAGGSPTPPYYVLAGLYGYTNTNGGYIPVYADRVYFKSAGTYTFRLEALADGSNAADAQTFMKTPFITATYYPSNYGSVTTVVSSSNAGATRRLTR